MPRARSFHRLRGFADTECAEAEGELSPQQDHLSLDALALAEDDMATINHSLSIDEAALAQGGAPSPSLHLAAEAVQAEAVGWQPNSKIGQGEAEAGLLPIR